MKTLNMKNKFQALAFLVAFAGLFIYGCRSASSTTAPEQSENAVSTVVATEAVLPTRTIKPTDVPNATVYPPVFNPLTIGDNRVPLDSFILTRNQKTTYSGTIDEVHTTVVFFREPFAASVVNQGTYSWADYWLNGVSYDRNTNGDLYLYTKASPDAYDPGFFQGEADMRAYENRPLSELLTGALFVEKKDFEGTPAFYFTLDETNVEGEVAGIYELSGAQGEFYLAREGNYLLYFHLKLNGSLYPSDSDLGFTPAVFEITEQLSSINQAPEITVPADFAALDAELGGAPLPPNTTFKGVIAYSGVNYEIHLHTLPMSFDEFLAYYRDLAPTNGWSVVSIGVKDPLHHICDSEDCVVLQKGGQKIVLYRDQGGIAADYYN